MHDDGQLQVNPYESVIGGRRDQAFPVLTEADISRVERFGERRRYRRGERLFAAGERTPGMFVVLKGALTMTARDGLGRTAQVVRHGPGQFTGEVAQLSTGVAVASNFLVYQYCGFTIDAERYPNLARYLREIIRVNVFQKALEQEKPFAQQMGLSRGFLN